MIIFGIDARSSERAIFTVLVTLSGSRNRYFSFMRAISWKKKASAIKYPVSVCLVHISSYRSRPKTTSNECKLNLNAEEKRKYKIVIIFSRVATVAADIASDNMSQSRGNSKLIFKFMRERRRTDKSRLIMSMVCRMNECVRSATRFSLKQVSEP